MPKKKITVDFRFREKLNKVQGGKHHNYCYQCSACVAVCPAARFTEEFNPRVILLKALLGMEEEQDSIDLVVNNPDIHGIALRDLHLPTDVIVLSTKRRGHPIISTGYTRLRLGDTLTIIGSVESIEQVRLRIE